jgi:M6 family metalloprotease-like protein
LKLFKSVLRDSSRFAVSLVGLWCLLAPQAARASAAIDVRPVATREALARMSEQQRRGRVELDPRQARSVADHARRWRSFHDDVFAKNFNRSPYARLRPGSTLPDLSPRSVAEHQALGTPLRTVKVAMIRIDFQNDREGDRSSGNGHFDLSGPDTLQPPIDRAPHNRPFYQAHAQALSRYYDVQSYGLIHVEADVWPRTRNGAYSLTDMADLGPWRFSRDIYPAARDMFQEMILAADSQSVAIGDRIPWDDYDRIVLIHAGSDLQSDVHQDSPLDIPSFTIGVDDTDVVVLPDIGRPIDRAAIIPETINQDGFYGAINGVLAHECGHLMFGFVDVYDVNSGFPVVGFWSLMDYGNGVGSIVRTATGEEIYATGFLAPSIDPWQRFRFMLNDALAIPEVVYGDTIPMLNSERHPDLRRVTLSSDEYLILENRYLSPADSVEVDQDDSTRVVLGPKSPDRFEVDALLPGGGILAWHVDESVYPLFEITFPIDTTLRVNPDFGLNSNPERRGLSIVEADGLADLGDPGSPYLLGAVFDPFFLSNNSSLSDSTQPNLRPHIGTRPHARLDFLDDPDSVMDVAAARVWQLPGWPIFADFPPGGPVLLGVDVDGSDRNLEVCWAGGVDSLVSGLDKVPNPDSAALFAVRLDGAGIGGGAHAFAHLDRRPRREMAAHATGEATGVGSPPAGPSFFAVSTYPAGADTSSPGGRVWLIDGTPARLGQPLPGWPARLPSIVTTPPVIDEQGTTYVGCADGRVYMIAEDASIVGFSSPPLAGGVVGRLAVVTPLNVDPIDEVSRFVAAGGAHGDIAIFEVRAGVLSARAGWPRRVGGFTPFDPEFLWIDFGGAANETGDCLRGDLSLVVHHADWLWAFCASSGAQLPGWGRDVGDTLIAGLGAGDPDGDGFPEVLTQSVDSEITFWNVTGYPSPGWPRRGTPEQFVERPLVVGTAGARPSMSPALAVDLDADRRSEVVALNVSGIIAALREDGKTPIGWPLATGLGAAGSPLAIDLDRDGRIEVIAPDRLGMLYGYTVPAPRTTPRAIEWPMLGGDPGRTAALALDPTLYAPPPGEVPGPLVNGSLMAYPNPARRHPVSFAYRLTESADVEFRIVDTSGHEVASFTRRGRQSDNLEVWDPSGLPAGLYMARLRFRGAGTDRTEVVPIGVLR